MGLHRKKNYVNTFKKIYKIKLGKSEKGFEYSY